MGGGPDHLPLWRLHASDGHDAILREQELLIGLPPRTGRGDRRARHRAPLSHRASGSSSSGAASTSIFFLQSGMVSVKLPDGVRLATLVPGTAFGEMALFEKPPHRRCLGGHPGRCIELPLEPLLPFPRSASCRSASASCAIWPACWCGGWVAPTRASICSARIKDHHSWLVTSRRLARHDLKCLESFRPCAW